MKQKRFPAGSDLEQPPAVTSGGQASGPPEPGSGVFIRVYESRDFLELVQTRKEGKPLVLRKMPLNGLVGASCRVAIRRMREVADSLGVEVEAVVREGQLPEVEA